MSGSGPGSTYGWYWAVDVLKASGANVHLAHPLMVRAMTAARVKNDRLDARLLADLLRTGLLPEAWVAPPAIRELRELVRYRAKLVAVRSALKNQVYSVLAKEGLPLTVTDLFGRTGEKILDNIPISGAYLQRVVSLRRLIGACTSEIAHIDVDIHRGLRDHAGWRAIQALPGVGPVLASVFVAEIGDISRFSRPEHLTSWAGLTPRHRESDNVVHRGHITKQGPPLVRWAAVEAVSRYRPTAKLAADKERIAKRRGNNIARVAVARKLLTLVYWGLRDGKIRCLEQDAA